MEQLTKHRRLIFLFIMMLIGVFMVWRPISIRNTILTSYKNKLAQSPNMLTEKEKQKIQNKIDLLEGRKKEEIKASDAQNYENRDFFNEPWRKWESSYNVWAHARNYFLVLFVLLAVKLGLEEYRDWEFKKRAVEEK